MPALPYRFAGRIRQDESSQLLLANGERILAVSEGQTLDGAWRVEQISADAIRLRYLPLARDVKIGVPGGASSPSSPAELTWNGPREVKRGATFSVALSATSAEPVRASRFELRFNPAVLEPLEVLAGRYYEDGNLSHRIDEDGRIEIHARHRNAAVAASAELFVVKLRAAKPVATTEISVDSLTLQAQGGGSIPSSVAAFQTAVR